MIYNKKTFKNFSISLLVQNDIHNFTEINDWFLEHIKAIDQLYLDEFKLKLNDIELNFGRYQCTSVNDMLRKTSEKKLKVSFFMSQTKKIDETLIIYDNPFLNQDDLNKDTIYEAKLIVMCPYEYKEILISFITQEVDLSKWSYGYGMSLQAKQTLDGSQIKTTIFSSKNIPLSTEKLWDNMLLTNSALSEKGFVKDIYELNILNLEQAKKIDLTSYSDKGIGKYFTKDEKYIWTLNPSEINLVKNDLKSNSFLISNLAK
ncbi:MAG: hypothetical protein Q3983_02325 [Capnocytophaga sp.]|nr:hypothetical protein [Capnocytophaga sp.]